LTRFRGPSPDSMCTIDLHRSLQVSSAREPVCLCCRRWAGLAVVRTRATGARPGEVPLCAWVRRDGAEELRLRHQLPAAGPSSRRGRAALGDGYSGLPRLPLPATTDDGLVSGGGSTWQALVVPRHRAPCSSPPPL
jgi:hypothetical protein